MMLRTGRGFTLPELLVVVTVMGVLLAIGIPSFTSFIRSQRIKTASFDVFSTLVFARSEAITRNTTVTITPTGGSWSNGWKVTYVDASSTTQLLRTQDSLPSITVAGKAGGAAPTLVAYRGSGRLNTTATPYFELSATGETTAIRCITVDPSGRPNSKASAC
jgi:type IV fimbrial biogenesis protein FimT